MPENLFNLLFFSIPFLVPLVIGLYLVVSRGSEFNLMAGLLTLKPILTTPIWLAIIVSDDGTGRSGSPIFLYSILPGASLTVLTLVIFRRLFYGPLLTTAMLLIVLDCLRWINSGLLLATTFLSYGNPISDLFCIFAPIGLIFPTAYAVIALTTTLVSNEARAVA